jgi:hypothetical protein
MRIVASLCLLWALAAGPLVAQPAPAAPTGNERVFELLTYTTPAGKLETLNARFRDHTLALFKKHGMEAIGFWEPIDADAGAGTKLVYLLSHRSRAAAEASWKAFVADPEWVAAKAASEKDGPILAKRERFYLKATDYSPLK